MHSSVNGYLGCFYVPAIINSAAMNIWRRQWQPTPVLLPGRSHGRRAWWAAVHGVAKSWTWLSDFTFTFHFHALEKEMATHSTVLAWRIPGTGEPGGLLSMGSHRVRHDWRDLVAAAAMNTQVHEFFFKLDLCPDICPGVGLQDYMATLSILRNLHTIFQHFTLPPIV